MAASKRQKLGDVVTLLLNKKGIQIICGSDRILVRNYDIFSSKVCCFLNDLSEVILFDRNLKLTDVISFAFWLRKRNINRYAKQYLDYNKRVGLGIVFHVTPSNIPTNFAYSFVFGLISGNSNILKVSKSESEQVKYILKKIELLFRKKKYKELRESNAFIRYDNDNEISDYLSSKCDARVLWGGNNTINLFKKFKTNERAREINFPDRYSICLVNANYLCKLGEKEIKKVVHDFFNDTYLVDQNACSSPRLIIWYFQQKKINIKLIKNKFWKLVEKKIVDYQLDTSLDYQKFSILCETLTTGNYKVGNFFKNSKLCVLQKESITDLSMLGMLKLGIFFEYETENINEIFKVKNKSIQTLSYIGFEKKYLRKYFEKNACTSYDRIVPVGTVLDMDLNWDGYTMPYELSRVVDIK